MQTKSFLARCAAGVRFFWIEHNGPAMAVLLGLVVLTLMPVYLYRHQDSMNSDFGLHFLFTRRMIQGNLAEIPEYALAHPGLQILMTAAYWFTLRKIPLVWLDVLILTSAQVLSALGYFLWLGKYAQRGWGWLKAGAAYALTISAPVMALAGLDGQYYFGYIGLASYHNPTIILLRPFALFSLLLIAQQIEDQSRASLGKILLSGFLIVFSALVKPSYVFCLLPFAFLYIAWRWLKGTAVDAPFWAWGVFVPGFIILGLQGALAYFHPDSGNNQIIFSPFTVESSFSGFLPYKILLSVIFPLTVLLVGGSKLFKQPILQITGLAFLFGAAQAYLLAESGTRLYDGNFRWGAQIMLFLFFAVVLRTWLRERYLNGKSSKLENGLVFSALFLHVIAGAVYYVYVFTHVTYG